jgi:uncharacterized phage-like protein YoqJ
MPQHALVIAATGHRPHKLGNEYSLKGPHCDYIRKKMRAYLRSFEIVSQPVKGISGMALGADTLWALTLLDLRIPLIAAVPFIGQERRWPKASQKVYNDILSHPLTTTKVICEGDYSAAKMHERDAWMVDNCDELVAVYDGSKSGGTAWTVTYATNAGKPIYKIDPEGWNKLAFDFIK